MEKEADASLPLFCVGKTSQAASQTAPLPRGASGEEGKFSGMPKPPLDRGGGTPSGVTERFNLFMKGNFSMQLSDTERQCLTAILAQYDQHPEVQRMREFIQHGDVTTYQHCKNVVLVSFWLNRRFHLGADETSLAVGAFLHDFYLYDWHKRSSFRGLRRLFEMHGFAHPGSACVNAERCFAITRKEQNIISSHMWPLTFRHVPTCREAVIVCLADKYCAGLESMFQRTRVADMDAADNEW